MEINKENLKEILTEQRKQTRKEISEDTRKCMTEQRKEFQRYIGVLTEDFDSKVQLIAEQYDSIINRLDSHDEKLLAIEHKMEIMKADIEMIKIDINFIKGSLKQKVDIEDFNALERRMILLEAKMRRV